MVRWNDCGDWSCSGRPAVAVLSCPAMQVLTLLLRALIIVSRFGEKINMLSTEYVVRI